MPPAPFSEHFRYFGSLRSSSDFGANERQTKPRWPSDYGATEAPWPVARGTGGQMRRLGLGYESRDTGEDRIPGALRFG